MLISRRIVLALGLSALAAGALVHSPAPAAAEGKLAKVVLEVDGFRNTKGQALVSVYNNDDTFMELDKAVKTLKLKITGKKMTITIPDLKPGHYSIGIIHDEDKNNDLKQWLGFGPPKEGVAMTRNPDGIPSFDKTKVEIKDKDRRFKLKVMYLGRNSG